MNHPAPAQSEYTVQFSKKLNQDGLFDYSEYLIQKALAAKPADPERLKVQLAETYIQQDRMADASVILKQIPPSSPFFISAQLATGMLFMQKNNTDQAISAFKSYLDSTKNKLPADEQGKSDYRMIVNALVNAYKLKGDVTQVSETFKLLEKIKDDPNEILLRDAFAKLDIAQNMKNEKKAGWEKIVNSTVKTFEDLKWGTDGPVPLFAEVGALRALYMLGKYDDAIKTFSTSYEKYKTVDDAFAERDSYDKSPSILRRYFEAKTYQAKAEAERKNSDNKKKYYGDALRQYVYILKKSPEFQYSQDVYNSVLVCKAAMEKIGMKVTLPQDLKKTTYIADTIRQDARTSSNNELDQLFAQKKYAMVAAYVSEKLLKDKASVFNDDAMGKYAISLAYTKKYQEAKSVCSTLVSNWPGSQTAASAVFQTGDILWNANALTDAKSIFEDLISCAKSTPQAGDAAMKIAKDNYDKAQNIFNSSYSEVGQNKERKYAAALSAYTDALPSLKRIVDDYSYRKEIYSSAVFMLAKTYTVLGRYNEAAELYESYCSSEKEDKLKLLKAKLGAADAYLRSGKYYDGNIAKLQMAMDSATDKNIKNKKASELAEEEKNSKNAYNLCIKNLNEILEKWIVPGGIVGPVKDPQMLSSIQSAQILLAWIYDITGEKKKACNELQKFIKKYPNAEEIPMCMARLAAMYYELNDSAATAKVFESLNLKYPQSPESRNAYFTIAKNMYEKGSFAKCFEVFAKLLAEPAGVSIASLNWMSENLSTAGNVHLKDGALLACKASQILLVKLERPDLQEWLAPEYWESIKDDKEAQQRTIALIRQKLSLNAGEAALFANDRALALKYYDEVIARRGAYYYDAKFARAELFEREGNFRSARRDFADIVAAASVSEKYSIASKAKCMIGDTFLTEKNYRKAFAVFSVLSLSLNESIGLFEKASAFKPADERRNLIDERGAEREWIETAIYKAALCASYMGLDEEKKKFISLYKTHFPAGKYSKNIQKLPAAQNVNDK